MALFRNKINVKNCKRLAGAIKVGFAQGRVDYTETVYDDLICLETDGEFDLRCLKYGCR